MVKGGEVHFPPGNPSEEWFWVCVKIPEILVLENADFFFLQGILHLNLHFMWPHSLKEGWIKYTENFILL